MKRSLVIDGIKLLASQLIVLHHLSLYAPMADALADEWPALVRFIREHGRLAVQPFLVIGGYLAAQALGKRSRFAPVPLVWQRYVRLAPPLLVALLLVVLSTVLFRDALAQETWLSPLPTLVQFVAQMFFLQDVLGIPSISAGAWYVAIDLQLFALFVLFAHANARLTGRPLAQSPVPAVVAAATVASIHFFSRSAALDAWAIYFLSAYGLGALVAWSQLEPANRPWLALAVFSLAVDWATDPRVRPPIALATAATLLVLSHRPWHAVKAPLRRLVGLGSDISYSVFVCHFAVIIVASGLWMRLELDGLGWATAFTLMAWLASLAVGAAVHVLLDRAWSMKQRVALR